MKSTLFPHFNPKSGLGPREVRPLPQVPSPFRNHLIFASSSCPCLSLGFCSFLKKNNPCTIRFGFLSSPVNRPCHQSVFLSNLFLPPDVRLPRKRAGYLSAWARAIHLLGLSRRRGRGQGRGCWGCFRFLRPRATLAPPFAGLRFCI